MDEFTRALPCVACWPHHPAKAIEVWDLGADEAAAREVLRVRLPSGIAAQDDLDLCALLFALVHARYEKHETALGAPGPVVASLGGARARLRRAAVAYVADGVSTEADGLLEDLVVALKNNPKNRTAREVADAYGGARRYLKKKEGRR